MMKETVCQTTLNVKYRYKEDSGTWSEWITTITDKDGNLPVDDLNCSTIDFEIIILGYNIPPGFDRWKMDMDNNFTNNLYNQNFIQEDTVTCKFLSSDINTEEKQKINLLLGWGYGEITDVEEIKINGEDTTYYNDAKNPNDPEVQISHNLGAVNQTALPGFDDSIFSEQTSSFPFILNRDVTTSAIITTEMLNADAVTFGFKTLLFRSRKDGLSGGHIYISIETMPSNYDKSNETDWTNYHDYSRNFTISGKNVNPTYKSVKIFSIPQGKHHIRVTRTGDTWVDDFDKADLSWQYCNTHNPIGYQYPGIAYSALSLLATSRLSGSTPDIKGIIKGLKLKVPNLSIGGIQVEYSDCFWDDFNQCYRFNGDNTNPWGTVCDYNTTTMAEQWTSNHFWIYYNCLLNAFWGLGDKVSSDQINFTEIQEASQWADELVKISADTSFVFDISATNITKITYTATTIAIEASPVISWTQDTGKDKYIEILSGTGKGQIRKISGNSTDGTITVFPALSPVPAQDDSFVVHQYLQKRFEFHGTIDKFMRVVDALKDLLFTARSHPAGVGKTYTVITDQDKPVTGFLNMANTIEDSFSESMTFEKPTHYRADFADQNNNFETTTHEIVDYFSTSNPGGFQIGDKITETSFQLWGSTTLDRTVMMLTYLKNKTKYCSRRATASVMLDNITALPGDVIRVQNDRPGWGWGARVAGSGTNYIDTSDPVIVTITESFLLKLRIKDTEYSYDVDETATISYAAGGDITRIFITGVFTVQPTVYEDLWLLEDETSSIAGKLFTIESIKRKNDNSAQIELLEYNKSVYNDLPVVPTMIVSSVLSSNPPEIEKVNVDIFWKASSSNVYEMQLSIGVKFSDINAFVGSNYFNFKVHTEDGDTTISLPVAPVYEDQYKIFEKTFEISAAIFKEKTIYVTAASVAPSGKRSSYCSPTVKYITTDTNSVLKQALIDNSISNAIIKYSWQPELATLKEISWDYSSSVQISGFIVMFRFQTFQWKWNLSASYLNTNTGKPSIDTASQGGIAAWNDLKNNMSNWKNILPVGHKFCYFHLDKGVDHEIIKVDLVNSDLTSDTWAVDRGQEGTVALSFSAGDILEYVAGPFTETGWYIYDIATRSYKWDKSSPFNQYLFASICPFIIFSDDTWARGNITLWTPEEIA